MDNKGKEKEEEKHQGTDIEEEEDEDGNKGIVVLGPQVPLKEQLELDKVSHWDSIKWWTFFYDVAFFISVLQ